MCVECGASSPVVQRNQSTAICPEINSGQEMSFYLPPFPTLDPAAVDVPLLFLGQRGPSRKYRFEA